MGFEELPHTADCALRVLATDLAGLFVEAALGLNFLGGTRVRGDPRVSRPVSLQALDAESLLVAFLSELIYAQENESLAFDQFSLQASSKSLFGGMEGSEILSLAKPIKAATFHDIQIRKSARGQEVVVVFDV